MRTWVTGLSLSLGTHSGSIFKLAKLSFLTNDNMKSRNSVFASNLTPYYIALLTKLLPKNWVLYSRRALLPTLFVIK